MDFYATAAQIGGILLIATAFELRLFAYRKGQIETGPKWLMPAVVGLSLPMLAAIAIPVAALAENSNTHSLRIATAATLILATFLVLLGGVVSWTAAAIREAQLDTDKKSQVEAGEKIAFGMLALLAVGGVAALLLV